MILAGIDYSLTSPGICVFDGPTWDIKYCKFHYLVQKEKYIVTNDRYSGTIYPEWNHDNVRYENLSSWSMDIIKSAKQVGIEGYAFGASAGRVFHIAENTGILKYKIFNAHKQLKIYAPSEIKKYATGKGNANKEKMYQAFFEETSVDVFNDLGITNRNLWNPVSDIVDAYYICKLLHSNSCLQ